MCSAAHLAPADARALIRERAREAIRRARDIRPVVFKAPYTFAIEGRKEVLSRSKVRRPGAESVHERAVRYRGNDRLLVLHHAVYGNRCLPDRRVLSVGWFRPCPSSRPRPALSHAVRVARGSRIRKMVPFPDALCTSTRPRCAKAICFTIDSPNPVPPNSRLRLLSTR